MKRLQASRPRLERLAQLSVTHLRQSLWLTVLFAFAACGTDESLPAWRTASLELATELTPTSPTTVRSVLATEGFEEWRTESKRKVRLGPSPMLESLGEPAINFRGKQVKTIICPGRSAPEDFNAIQIRLITAGHTRLFAWFERGGERATPDSQVFVEKSETPSWVTVPFLHNQLESQPFDALCLRFAGEGDALSIFEIRWMQESNLPPIEPGEVEPELLYLRDEGRRAWPVLTSVPSYALFEIRESSRLTFSYGVPRERFHARAGLRLHLTLRHESGEELEREFPYPCASWETAHVDLGSWKPGQVEARFQTRALENFEGAGFVTPLWIDESGPPPPTVLFITSDTHRADHVEAANLGVRVDTPTLDELARGGVLYEQAWSTTNVTIPSHAALMTGVHPRDTKVIDNQTALSEDARTLAENFKAEGWSTLALVSARHLDSRYSGLGQGFDRMLASPRGTRPAEETIEVLEGWLDEAPHRPLFIWLHLFDAHAPYAERSPWNEDYLSTATPGPAGQIAVGIRYRAHYRSEVSYLDQQLARILERPRFEQAVIAFTADHGESLGAHGIDFQHLELYPDTTHVPLILRWPDCPEGTRVSGPIRQLDLGRTLLDLAGLEEAPFPGERLRFASEIGGASHGPEAGVEEGDALHSLGAMGLSASRLEDGWLAILHLVEHRVDSPNGLEYARHQVELFHLSQDPGCERDLVHEELERAKSMRKALIGWLLQAEPRGLARRAQLDQAALEELVKLGYSGEQSEEISEWFPSSCECTLCLTFED